jgi:hypothetical protein
MRPTPVHHRLPRAGVDPITDAESAFVTASMAVHRPLRPETVVVLLDDARCGLAIAVVTGTEHPDDVIEVVECLANPCALDVGAMVVATVRPRGADDPTSGATSDVDRWLEMSDLADQAGIELLEWFVIGPNVTCPRDQLGEPPRW